MIYFGLILIIILVILIDKYLLEPGIERTTFKYPSVREQLQKIVKWDRIRFVADYELAGYRVYRYVDKGFSTFQGYKLERTYYFVPFTDIKFNKGE